MTSTCHDVDVNSQDCDSKIISSTSMTQGDDVAMPLESTTCSALETMSTKTFYGSSASPDDVFPKQYSAQHGQHKSKQKKCEVKQSIIEGLFGLVLSTIFVVLSLAMGVSGNFIEGWC